MRKAGEMQKVYCIDEDGIHGLWDDDICVGLGQAKIQRASDVEPTEDGKWIVRLKIQKEFSPSRGDVFIADDLSGNCDLTFDRTQARKFDRRDDAIKEEIRYLNDYILRGGKL